MKPTSSFRLRRQHGFSLVELMISITISLLILAGLSAMLVNVSNTNNEMAKSNSQIENGRFAIQVLENDLIHAGFWGEYVPQFDDQNWQPIPYDTPSAVPDPCLAYSATNWNFDYVSNLLGIPLASSDGALGNCTLSSRKTNTDALVVRHAAPCVPGEPNCAVAADTTGKLYFQVSMCASATTGTAQAAGNNSTHIALAAPSSAVNTAVTTDAYKGMTLRIVGGAGAGQTRTISAFDGGTFVATVATAFSPVPDATSIYTIVDYVLSTDTFPLRTRNCTTDVAPKRKFESTIYYIRDYANTADDGIPTLVRSRFDPDGPAALAHQAAEPLVEGIERMQIEFGIDDTVNRCSLGTAVNFGQAVIKVNKTTCLAAGMRTLPRNRGDGNPDRYVRCTTAAPCSAGDLSNVVATKLFLLVRNAEVTRGYTDTKTYCLASLPASGTCPSDSVAGPFSDGYKRHLFSTTIRQTATSGRRESP